MMSETLSIIYVVIASLFTNKILAQYCDSQQTCTMAFNLGRFVFFGVRDTPRNIWQFDAKNYKIYVQKLDISDIFYDNALVTINTSVGFNFMHCQYRDANSDFCRVTEKAKNIVLTVGQKLQKANSNKMMYAYVAHRMDSEQSPELTQIFDSDMVWGLKSQGPMVEKFWKISEKNLTAKIAIFESMVFVPQRNELYASVQLNNKTSVFKKKLNESTGEWSEWTHVRDIGFIGLFAVRGRVFGMDSNDMITEFIFIGSKVEFLKKSDSKEFFNCYGNSTLILPYNPQIFTTTEDDVQSSPTISDHNQTNTDNAAIGNTSKSKPKSSSLTTIIIIIVVIAIIILIIGSSILLWFLLCRRKPSSTPAEAADSLGSKPESKQSFDLKSKPSESKRESSLESAAKPQTSSTSTVRSNKDLFADWETSDEKNGSDQKPKRVEADIKRVGYEIKRVGSDPKRKGSTTSIKTIRSEF